MPKPVLATGLLALMCGAWYWALVPAVPAAGEAAPTDPDATPGAAAVPVVALDALARRAAPPPTAVHRNPFGLMPRPIGTSARPAAAPADTAPEVPVPPRPVPPVLTLIGVATVADGDGAGVERTAIVSAPDGVHHLRVGDEVAGLYQVVGVGDEDVELRLVREGRTLRLVLRR